MQILIPHWLIVAGGIGQMFTALIYPFVRHRVFNWYADIKNLSPLNQAIAKTYGYYIQGLNFGFGLMSVCLTGALQNGTPLAAAVTGLVAAYWVGKLATQFAYYPMYQIQKKPLFKLGEVGMNGLFVLFAVVYVGLFLGNVWHLANT